MCWLDVLIKHEHELEAMRRQQDEAVEQALAEAWKDSQQHSQALRKSLAEQESTIAKLRHDVREPGGLQEAVCLHASLSAR